MFKEIPFELFKAFHREFKGDTWDACRSCGGQCEINKIGSLMPGEADFLAQSIGEDVNSFKAKYLDGITTE